MWLFLDSLSACPGVSFDSLGRVEDLSGIKIQWSWVNGLLRCQVLHVADASQSSICDVMGKKESWHFLICIDVHGCAHCGRATALVCKIALTRAVDLVTDLTPDSTGVSLQDGEQGKALLLMDLRPLMQMSFFVLELVKDRALYSRDLSICLDPTTV